MSVPFFMYENSYSNISFVYDHGSSGFVFIDESLALFLNTASENITPEFLLSCVYADDADYLKAMYAELLTGSVIDSIEFRIVIEGKIHTVRLTPFLVITEGKTLIIARLADITSQSNNFDIIRRYANKKNSILNMLAHDLRGPLNIARTLTKSIGKKIDDPALLNMTKSIGGILDQSISLIINLIDRELLETVDVELSMQRVDIAGKVAEYIEECKRSENAADRIFKFSSSKTSIYLEVDEAKFMQIMNNLVTNSLKFTRPGSIISMDIFDYDESVRFSLSDNGIGIPEELHSNIFEKFTKARREGLKGEPSTGLGLSIVKMIVEWHKGKVWFESEENVGTTFFFEIPKVLMQRDRMRPPGNPGRG